MLITVKLFAILRDRAGVSEIQLTLPADATAEIALQRLATEYPALSNHLSGIALAVNREYVSPTHRLADGDELALIPPVSGG